MEKKHLTLEQLYNCDETGLCYRALPTKTIAGRCERSAPGMKKQKDRVTLMSCSNSTGTHKLPLMFVGESLNPRCFKHINKASLPVKYYAQKNAWVDANIFTDWFEKHFVPSVKKLLTEKGLPIKALLLLGSSTSRY